MRADRSRAAASTARRDHRRPGWWRGLPVLLLSSVTYTAGCDTLMNQDAHVAALPGVRSDVHHAARAGAHPDVQRALDYQLAASTCIPPDVRTRSDRPGQAERFAQQYARYAKCVAGYQSALYQDFLFIQRAVSHGVTALQAMVLEERLTAIAARIKAMRTEAAAVRQRWLRAAGERHRVDMSGEDVTAGDRMLDIKM